MRLTHSKNDFSKNADRVFTPCVCGFVRIWSGGASTEKHVKNESLDYWIIDKMHHHN